MPMSSLFALLITVIVVGAVFYLLFWLVGYLGLPEPFAKVARVVLAVIAVLYLLAMLTGSAPRIIW